MNHAVHGAAFEPWIVALPKVELHVHLEGTIDPALVVEAPASGPTWLDERVSPRVSQWLRTMRATTRMRLRSPEDYAAAAQRYIDELIAQRVIHAEISVAIPAELVEPGGRIAILRAVCEVARAVEDRISVGVLAGLDHASLAERLDTHIAIAIELRDEGVVGVDVHGIPEPSFEKFVGPFARARAAGLGLRVHAGEFRGPSSVRDAIERLAVDRIAHGVRAVEQPELLELLATRGVGLDLCLSSNVVFGVVESFAAHPVRRLRDAGVPISISTDDPTYVETSLTREYQIAAELGFSPAELAAINRAAIMQAFVSEQRRARLLAMLEAPVTTPTLPS